jgi:predicted PhzF superfamily epimerase YddE/YHI9
MAQSIVQVDSFTGEPFRGNPAGVCIMIAAADDAWMANVAREMNLSETAFLYPAGDGYNLRWFTPSVEVSLCGHATLASAHVLWQDGHLGESDAARFHTKSGLLECTRTGDWISMDFPAEPARMIDPPGALLRGLGVDPTWVGKNRLDYLVEVDSEEAVRSVRPIFDLLAEVPVRGAMVTSRAKDKDYDYVSRFFAPGSGVAEDPVTGSAHCCLGPYWSEKLGRSDLVGYQASQRGGFVRTGVRGDRVLLTGQAVTVLRGELVSH